ncbi:MAG: hypothetical protein ACREEB_00775 [Caulobacteraceae bacterium]
MTDNERKQLLAKIEKETKQAKSLTREEARRRLIDGGFLTEDGQLSARYGGKIAARG